MTETDAKSLLRRAERILWIAETIAAQAQRDDDARLALQAADRARSSLETMMKATGLIGGDTSVTINVDHRKQVVQLFESFPEATLRALQRGSCQHCGKSLDVAGETSEVEIGTSIRDQKALTAS